LALIKDGWWQDTWWASRWWQEDYWAEYGTAVAAASSFGGGGAVPLKPTTEVLLHGAQFYSVKGCRLHSFSGSWLVKAGFYSLGVKAWKLGFKRFSPEYYSLIGRILRLENIVDKRLLKLDFARWESFDACCTEMLGYGHSNEAAQSICKGVESRVADGTLYKSRDKMEIIKKDKDIYTYGPASWEVMDPEGDFITTEAQQNFLRKLFSVVPERYRNIMDEHDDFQAGVPLLSFTDKDGKQYYSHVHEKGMMLCTKARPDDGLSRTKEVREKLLKGDYTSYSIAGRPVRFESKIEKGSKVTYHYDIDPHEISYCARAMNPAVQGLVEVIRKKDEVTLINQSDVLIPEKDKSWVNPKYSKAVVEKIQEDLKKPFAGYKDFADCVEKHTGKVEDPKAYCASIQQESEKGEHRALPHTIRVDEDEVYKKFQAITEQPSEREASVDEIKEILRKEWKLTG
jgi:hypothetical protein